MAEKQASLRTVARIRADAEAEAGRELGAAEARLEQEEAQLATVRTMLADYTTRTSWSAKGPQELRDTRYFLTRLQAGVEAQTAVVEQQQRRTEAARAHWIATRLQREAVDQVIDERRAAEAADRERREQRQADDRAARPDTGPFVRANWRMGVAG